MKRWHTYKSINPHEFINFLISSIFAHNRHTLNLKIVVPSILILIVIEPKLCNGTRFSYKQDQQSNWNHNSGPRIDKERHYTNTTLTLTWGVNSNEYPKHKGNPACSIFGKPSDIYVYTERVLNVFACFSSESMLKSFIYILSVYVFNLRMSHSEVWLGLNYIFAKNYLLRSCNRFSLKHASVWIVLPKMDFNNR